jgi:hypothetical protein
VLPVLPNELRTTATPPEAFDPIRTYEVRQYSCEYRQAAPWYEFPRLLRRPPIIMRFALYFLPHGDLVSIVVQHVSPPVPQLQVGGHLELNDASKAVQVAATAALRAAAALPGAISSILLPISGEPGLA